MGNIYDPRVPFRRAAQRFFTRTLTRLSLALVVSVYLLSQGAKRLCTLGDREQSPCPTWRGDAQVRKRPQQNHPPCPWKASGPCSVPGTISLLTYEIPTRSDKISDVLMQLLWNRAGKLYKIYLLRLWCVYSQGTGDLKVAASKIHVSLRVIIRDHN